MTTMITDYDKVAIIAGRNRISYAQMLQRISHFAQQMSGAKGERCVIFSENREGWIYALFAIWQQGGIAVPVDASSTVGDLSFILGDCTPKYIWTSRQKIDTLQAALGEKGLHTEVLLVEEHEEDETSEEKAVITWKDDDTALIVYTSGTTGNPKGVMLSFRNIMANVRAVSEEVPIFNKERRTLIFLPLHHVLPLLGSMVIPLMKGGGVAIAPSMGPSHLKETMQEGIAIAIGVPRLWQTMFNGIKRTIDANAVTKALYWICKKANSRTLSRIVFKTVRDKLGGKLDYCVSGGAALDKEIAVGLKTLGLDVLEGYGMTETAPMIAFTRPWDIVPGSVGLPLPSVQTKILANGELCAKGPNVMQGYYNNPEATAAVIDKDGWLHTGDLARFDKKGRLYITGRMKEIIVLSNGKNVNPAEIEYMLEKYADKVKEVAVTEWEDKLVAIVVPQTEWAEGKSDEEMESLLKSEVLNPYNLTVEQYKKVMGVFVLHGELPRTKLDKIQRFKLQAILKSGKHRTGAKTGVVEPTFDEYVMLRDYIATSKKHPVLPTDHIETDLGFDSLDRVGLQGFIEHTFGMEMKADTMAAYHNVQEMAEYIAKVRTRKDTAAAEEWESMEGEDWHQMLNEPLAKGQKMPNFWWTGHMIAGLARLCFGPYFHLKVKGLERLPKKGPFILVPNHQSYIDGLLVVCKLPSKLLAKNHFYAKEDHVNTPTLRFIARHHNVIVMERENLRNSIVKIAEVLRRGEVLTIFPEGTRTTDGKVGTFKKTFVILSQELGVPIIPVAIKGAYEAMPKGQKYPLSSPIEVEYLAPYEPDAALTYEENAKRVRDCVSSVF